MSSTRLRAALLVCLAGGLVLPAAAAGATVTGETRAGPDDTLGVMKFIAAKGEENMLTVRFDGNSVRFRDSANRVKARGDCEQLSRHIAHCPKTADLAQVRLGDRGDRAVVVLAEVEVFGGTGNDDLIGGDWRDSLRGDRGADELTGGAMADVLVGGPGRDRILGGASNDTLVDAETDAQSAPDVFDGGESRDNPYSDFGDSISYELRTRPVRIDLDRGRSNTGDEILGIEHVGGGSGADRLIGTDDDGNLHGAAGNDWLDGAGGDDIVSGGPGDDTVDGGEGNDTVWGNAGDDTLFGGAGDDGLISRDGKYPETLTCGSGADTADGGEAGGLLTDTLEGCEIAASALLDQYGMVGGVLWVEAQPRLADETATFGVTCSTSGDGGCSGTISLTSVDTGEFYGHGDFDVPNDPFTPYTFKDVEVQLTPAGRAALDRGDLAQVSYGEAGYRIFIKRA